MEVRKRGREEGRDGRKGRGRKERTKEKKRSGKEDLQTVIRQALD